MQSQTNNVKEIELFGKKLLLSERTARDVNKLIEYSHGKEMSYGDAIIQSVIVLRDALKINFTKLRWWQVLTRHTLSKILSQEYLFNNLSTRQILDLSGMVLELEGVDTKKKVTPKKTEVSAETLQTV